MKKETNIKKYIFLIVFGLTLFLLSRCERFSAAQTVEESNLDSWFVYHLQDEKDYDGDGMPDCNSTFIPINETFLEIRVKATQKGGYKWASVLCNVSGVYEVGKWEYNPATDTWSYTSLLNYGKLVDYGLPSDWCNETNNYGFIIFGSGSGDKRYRLNFTEGHKVIQIYTGKGSEIKEAMTSKYFNQLWDKHNDIASWVDNQTKEAYENGIELYWKDDNLTIIVEGSNVSVEYTTFYKNKNVSKLIAFRGIAWKFVCVNYSSIFDPTFPIKNLIICPNQNLTEIMKTISREEMKSDIRIAKDIAIDSFSLVYLLGNNKTGDLVEYESKSTPSIDFRYNITRINPSNIFSFSNISITVNFKVNFAEDIKCIKFPLSTYANLTLNVTMPSPIVSYTLGRFPEIIIENYTIGNSLIAKIRPYPFNGIKNMEEQMGEVCW